MERVLVTGGAGFIGSALAWALNRQGTDRIIVTDRLGTDDKWRNLNALRFEDYLDADDLFERLENGTLGRFDLVLHMGACSSTTERDASYLNRNNHEYTKRLAHWALRHESRFVYASSAATYGAGSAGMRDTEGALAELQPLRPLNAYGYSKQLFDLYAARHGLLEHIVGLKFFNVFGPNEDHKGDMRSVVHKAYGQICEEGRVRLFRSYRADYADGEQRRDFLYIKDAVAMTLHLAGARGARGLYNIGAGEAHTWLELVGGVFAALGREPVIEFIDMPPVLRDRYQYFTCADLSRLRASGFSAPARPLADAIADYVRAYLVHDRRLGEATEEGETS